MKTRNSILKSSNLSNLQIINCSEPGTRNPEPNYCAFLRTAMPRQSQSVLTNYLYFKGLIPVGTNNENLKIECLLQAEKVIAEQTTFGLIQKNSAYT